MFTNYFHRYLHSIFDNPYSSYFCGITLSPSLYILSVATVYFCFNWRCIMCVRDQVVLVNILLLLFLYYYLHYTGHKFSLKFDGNIDHVRVINLLIFSYHISRWSFKVRFFHVGCVLVEFSSKGTSLRPTYLLT